MKHGIGQNDLVMKLRIESRIADPEGADRQMGIVGREISKRAVREVVDNGYAATAREQQIDQRRSKKPRPPGNKNMRPSAEFNHISGMVIQNCHPPVLPVTARRPQDSLLYSQGHDEQPVSISNPRFFFVLRVVSEVWTSAANLPDTGGLR